jgi:hypothetical protein
VTGLRRGRITPESFQSAWHQIVVTQGVAPSVLCFGKEQQGPLEKISRDFRRKPPTDYRGAATKSDESSNIPRQLAPEEQHLSTASFDTQEQIPKGLK